MNMRIAAALLLVAGCAKSAEQQQAEAAIRQLAEVGKQMGEAAGAAVGAAAGVALGTVKASEPVDFRALKDLLPEEAGGIKRTSSEGEKAGAMGFVVSNAEGRYESEAGARITIKITDMGAMAGVGALGAYAWAMAEVDKETESGYERTVSIKGNRGYEKYDRQNQSGEVSLMVAGRFIVEVDGYGVPIEALKDALDKVDLGKLEGMKNVGVK